MSKYIIGRKHWRDHSSKYGLNPDQFEKDVVENRKRYDYKKQLFKQILTALINCTTYQEENYHLLIEVLKEIKFENEKVSK